MESADPPVLAALARALGRHAIALTIGLLALGASYGIDVAIGAREAAATRGTLAVRGLLAPVTILRDERGVPHIRAAGDHDLYFAEGYVQGSDRLFQLELTRRYAYGTLAEVLGRNALRYDEMQRAADIAGIARRQERALPARIRAALVAFSAGVNAAIATQPLPVEFRMLLYRPAPWTPRDSLAVSIVASLELADPWHDVFARDAVWRRDARCFDARFPLSDARYDVTVRGDRGETRSNDAASACAGENLAAHLPARAIGSNAWAAGSARTRDGRALIANDPHIDLTIPGIWYLVDIESPHLHAAGATIPGVPGVVLGHNERIAWASTNGQMTTASVFQSGRLDPARWVTERFRVRFSRDVRLPYYRTAREFSVPDENDPSAVALVRWPVYAQTRSTIDTALGLDSAGTVADALRVLAGYRGSPQNFIVAGRDGRIAYHVAGLVPDDPAWGRYVHPARDLRRAFAPLAFMDLPSLEPSRDAILISANNKGYGADYRYRLSAQFEPPYRAYRIAALLRARRRYDGAYFAAMQLDTLSPIDLEIAHRVLHVARVPLLQGWDGRFTPSSHAAALEHALRLAVLDDGPAFRTRFGALRGAGAASTLGDDIHGTLEALALRRLDAWGDAGGMRIAHPLAAMNFGFLNGDWLPGAGDEYTIHLQETGFAQGFRAVWEVGAWDRGGIAIPSGESGEPGSPHYRDLTARWIGGELTPLWFGPAAVAAHASETLVLRPQPSPT